MEIIPAVHVRGGKCVRLWQGDYGQGTVFDEDPVSAALTWRSQGARWLHIVDLDGAIAGELQNMETAGQIIKESCLLTQVGDRIRREYVTTRLIFGTSTRLVRPCPINRAITLQEPFPLVFRRQLTTRQPRAGAVIATPRQVGARNDRAV